MQQLLSLIQMLVKDCPQARCLVMALIQYFPARELLHLGRELIERAEAAIGKENEPEPDSIPVVPVPEVVPVVAEPMPHVDTFHFVEQPAAEPETPVETPAAKPARKPRKTAVKAAE